MIIVMSSIFIIKIPITRLNSILYSLGIDRHQFHDYFKLASTRTPYPVIYGGKEAVRRRMCIRPNAYAFLKNSRADFIFKRFAGRILLPDRIWWDTAHVIALYSEEPVLSNIFYAANLKAADNIRAFAEKSLILWLNSVWGVLTVLFNRQETRGRWTSLKISQWRLLPVLDVTRLDFDTLKTLAGIFDKYCGESLARIPQQFNPKNPDPVRLKIDLELLKALTSGLDETRAKEALLDLYKRLYEGFISWMRGR